MTEINPSQSTVANKLIREGDTIAIRGDYQFKALTAGNRIQRSWHSSKTLAIKRLLPPAAGDRVIDVGCGSGVITDFLGRSSAEALGVDANPDAISFASNAFGSERVSFRVGLADQPLCSDASVDKIYCLELIEHIYYRQSVAVLGNFHRSLKPGGNVFLTTPNYHSLWPCIEWLMDFLKLAPSMGKHQHVEHYHRAKLHALCVAQGFRVEYMGTMCFAAPWLAVLSRRLAQTAAKLEIGRTAIAGSILVCVLSKAK